MEGEMIRAVVADDEKIIREGIAEWVDWNKLGICLVAAPKTARRPWRRCGSIRRICWSRISGCPA